MAPVVDDRTEGGEYTCGIHRATRLPGIPEGIRWTGPGELIPHEVDLPSTEQTERVDVAAVETRPPVEVGGGLRQQPEHLPGLNTVAGSDEPRIQVAVGRLKPRSIKGPMADGHPALARDKPRERHEARQRGMHRLTRRRGQVHAPVAGREGICGGIEPLQHETRDWRNHTERRRHEQNTDHDHARTVRAGQHA